MPIYDIHGKVISTGDFGGDGEILDGSVTPAKTTFFNEEPTYKLIDLGEMESGLFYDNGSLSNHSAYVRTADYVAVDNVGKIYYVSNPSGLVRVVCYDSNKAFIGATMNTTKYKDNFFQRRTDIQAH